MSNQPSPYSQGSPEFCDPHASHDAKVRELEAEIQKMRKAARALVDTLTSNGGRRPCGNCYALATVAEPLPRGGSVYRCDKHASPPMTEQEREFDRTYGDNLGDGRPTVVSEPLRALRALLDGGKP